MAEIRLKDYEDADAENLNRLAVSAYEQFRHHYEDWPAMLAGLSKTSALSASGELIVAELESKLAGAVAYFGPNSQKAAFFDQRGRSFACWSSTRRFAEKELGKR